MLLLLLLLAVVQLSCASGEEPFRQHKLGIHQCTARILALGGVRPLVELGSVALSYQVPHADYG